LIAALWTGELQHLSLSSLAIVAWCTLQLLLLPLGPLSHHLQVVQRNPCSGALGLVIVLSYGVADSHGQGRDLDEALHVAVLRLLVNVDVGHVKVLLLADLGQNLLRVQVPGLERSRVKLGQALPVRIRQLFVEGGNLLAFLWVEGVHLHVGHLLHHLLVLHAHLSNLLAAVRPQILQFVDHFLSSLTLRIFFGTSRAALFQLSHRANNSKISLVGLTANDVGGVGRHGQPVLHAELLQRAHRVPRCLGRVGVWHGGQRLLTVLGGHSTIQFIQHCSGSGVLGLLLAAPGTNGGHVPQDNLEGEGGGMTGTVRLNHAVRRGYPTGLESLLESPDRVGFVVTHVGRVPLTSGLVVYRSTVVLLNVVVRRLPVVLLVSLLLSRGVSCNCWVLDVGQRS